MASRKKRSRDQKRKLKQQKRQQRRPPGGVPFHGMLQRAGLDNYKLISTPAHAEKMSEVLLDFMEPYKDLAPSTDAKHKLITTAIVAWNTALLPKKEGKQKLQDLVCGLPDEVQDDFLAIVQEMMKRKQRYFAQYTRFIVDYKLTVRKDGDHLSVISTLEGEQHVS